MINAANANAKPRYAIIGTGSTGISCARYLRDQGERFVLLDSRPEPPQAAQVLREFSDVDVLLGELPESVLSNVEQLIVSPGVSLDEPVIRQALDQGVGLSSDLDLFRSALGGKLVCITGSNGKSTVATLVANAANRDGIHTALCGNIGTPVLETLALQAELTVVEVSSFQLERCAPLRADVATVLNISADHMDRYQSLADYQATKLRIYQAAKLCVFNRDDPATHSEECETELSFGSGQPAAADYGLDLIDGRQYLMCGLQAILPTNDIRIRGRHNVLNALACIALGDALGISRPALCDELRQFPGLPHRCETVATVDRVTYINDSKGTNVGASIAAIDGLATAGAPSIVLIAGGVGKQADFSTLQASVRKHVRALIVFGQDAPQLQQQLQSYTQVIEAAGVDRAVAVATATAQPGDTVLFSPACASFDMFDDYQQRGDAFKSAVHKLVNTRLVN